MNKQVLFIQGAGKGAYKEDEKLVASLRQLLGSEFEVRAKRALASTAK